MNSGKRISASWNSLLCFFLGHTLTTVCTRCGKYVNLQGKRKVTMEERINNWWNNRNKKHEPEFKGSLKLKPGLTKYSLNMKTNELKTVSYTEDYEAIRDNKGEIKYDKDGFPLMRVKSRKAKFDPMLVYIDAMNDETAIRKANNYLFGIKPGVKITQVTREEVNAMEFSMN